MKQQIPHGLKITFLFEGLAPLEWLNVVILGSFAIAFTVFFTRIRST